MSQYCKCLGGFVTSCNADVGCPSKVKDKESNNQNTEPMV